MKILLIVLKKSRELREIAEPKEGLSTSDNKRFLRLWWEVNILLEQLNSKDIDSAKNPMAKWFPFNKGGNYRKWYGNNDYVINYKNDGKELLDTRKAAIRNQKFYFNESITWSLISSSDIAFRYKPYGHIFDAAGSSIFSDTNCILLLLGFCNTVVAMMLLKVIAPTLNYAPGSVGVLPVIDIEAEKKNKIVDIVKENIKLSKSDWDSFETSWDFKKHPLV